MSTVHIYALVDSRDPDEPRYIGMTRDLDRRLKQHVRGAAHEHHHRACWIRKTLRDGGSIRIRSVALVPEESADRLEIDYIGFYRRAGFRLTNGTIGGESGHCRTPEARRRHAERMKTVFTDDVRQRISAAVKQTFADPNIRRELSDRMKRSWSDPSSRRRRLDGMNAAWSTTQARSNLKAALNDPDVAARRHVGQKTAWADPEVRSRHIASMLSALSNPATKQKISDGLRRRFADPEARRRHSEAMKASWARRRAVRENGEEQ